MLHELGAITLRLLVVMLGNRLEHARAKFHFVDLGLCRDPSTRIDLGVEIFA